MGKTNVYIVGAGFSKYSGLPLQKDFTEALLTPRTDKEYPLHPFLKDLIDFIHDSFGHSRGAKAKFWPNLEDIFTNIDLAANSGHYLGPGYPPSKLRETRRKLLACIMNMLHERYLKSSLVKSTDSEQFKKLFMQLNIARDSFISMNWDTVIECKLEEYKNINNFNYHCEEIPAVFPTSKTVISKREFKNESSMTIIKIHGSTNWLYCDNCHQLYWFPPKDAMQVSLQIIKIEEGRHLKLPQLTGCSKWKCLNCQEVPLTTRIATFSYLKALDFPMFERSWLSAERLLQYSKKWIFIGYSLPAADYEFKHLLKRVQLSRNISPEFVVITGGQNSSQTFSNYQGFFGRSIKRMKNYFDCGLTNEAIRAIRA